MTGNQARVAVIIPAAGSGQRLGGGTPKALRLLDGRSMLDHALMAMASHPAVVEVVVAVPAGEVAKVSASLPEVDAEVSVVAGGDSRQASVAAALRATHDDCGIVLVHDAARPLVPADVIDRVIAALTEGAEAVVPGLPVVDTIKIIDADGAVVSTPSRHLLRAVQTPQGFARGVLLASHAGAPDRDTATDDAALAEHAGFRVVVVDGDPAAMKVTTQEDLQRAEQVLAMREGR